MARLGRGRRQRTSYLRARSANVARPLPPKQPKTVAQAQRRKVHPRPNQRHDTIIIRPPRTGLPASSYTPTVKHVYVYSKSLRNRLNPRANVRNQAQVVKPSFRPGIVTSVKTIVSITVKRSRRPALVRALRRGSTSVLVVPKQPLGSTRTTPKTSTHTGTMRRPVWARVRRQDKARIVRPRQPLGSTRSVPRVTVRISRRPTQTRALIRGLVQVRPSRTGLPASAYFPTIKPILVRSQAIKRKLNPRATTRKHQAIVVKPPLRGVASIFTRTIKPIFVRISRRPATVKALRRRQPRQRLVVPRQPFGSTRTTPRVVTSRTQPRRRTHPRVTMRHETIIVKPSFRSAVFTTAKTILPIIVKMSRRAATVKAQQRGSRATMTARRQPLGSTLTAPRVQTNVQTRRPSVRRATIRGTVLLRSLGGSAVAAVIVVTGRFRPGHPAPGDDAGTPGQAGFDPTRMNGEDPGTPGGSFYDPGTPGGGAE